jgi:hypothetical protein
MNVSVAPRLTRAAEGLPRRRFTVAEVEAMVEAGIMDEDERVELIGGESVPMSPKGNHNEVFKIALQRRWRARDESKRLLYGRSCALAAGAATSRAAENTPAPTEPAMLPRCRTDQKTGKPQTRAGMQSYRIEGGKLVATRLSMQPLGASWMTPPRRSIGPARRRSLKRRKRWCGALGDAQK